MARRWPPTPPTRVTATGANSLGPIGLTQAGIDFLARTGYKLAYLKRAPNQSQSPEKELERLGASVT